MLCTVIHCFQQSQRQAVVTGSSHLSWDFQRWQNFIKHGHLIFFTAFASKCLISLLFQVFIFITSRWVQTTVILAFILVCNGMWSAVSVWKAEGGKAETQCSASFPKVWKILFQYTLHCGSYGREFGLHRPPCQVSFQVPSLLHKSFHKATACFMKQDQREQRKGKSISRDLFLFCRIGSCCCGCLSQWSIGFAFSLGSDR